MIETPEEAKFFEEQKAADRQPEPEHEEEEQISDAEAETPTGEDAPEPDEAAAPADEAAATEEVEEEGRRVPIGELYAEREKRKELQAKISQLEGTFSRVMERLNQGQQPAAPPPQQPQIPDYASDPVGHIKAKLDLIEMATGGHQQAIMQQNALQQFSTALAGMESDFRSRVADYDAAVEFAKRSRDAELAALGYDPAQRVARLRDEIIGASYDAMNRGQNPAEMFYAYAKTRGFQANGNGAQQQPKPKVDTAAKLATVAKGQSSGRSLPRGGAAPPAAITLESLAQMDDAEFDKNFDKFWRKT